MQAQADQQKWNRVASDPSLSPKAAHWAREQARSAGAERRLREKAASYQDPNADQSQQQAMGGTDQPSPLSPQPSSLPRNPLT